MTIGPCTCPREDDPARKGTLLLLDPACPIHGEHSRWMRRARARLANALRVEQATAAAVKGSTPRAAP